MENSELLKKTITNPGRKQVWWCGCDIEGSLNYPWSDSVDHESYFDKKSFNKILICHKMRAYKSIIYYKYK